MRPRAKRPPTAPVQFVRGERGLELCDDVAERRPGLVLEALQRALDGVLHPWSTRDEPCVFGPGSGGDDEAVLVADRNFVLVHPPVLLADRLPQRPRGLGGTTELCGDLNGERQALWNHFLAQATWFRPWMRTVTRPEGAAS